ncbi:MAG: TipAS antibiotic-recognition domain-containing protein [Lachnotalea sp.]
MKTVKQVSDLTGVSVRMLHYYDEIGLLKPSEVTDTGYRLYDEEALMMLQQILFYKELDIPLKEVKEILYSPNYNKMQALENQKKMLLLKCSRLNDLVELINKALKGENSMSFKEFDMSEYYNALEELKDEHTDIILKSYGSMEKYDKFIESCKSKETAIAKMALKKYGSINKYVSAMKKNYNSDIMTYADQIDEFKKDCLEDKNPKIKELYDKLTFDLSKDPSSKEIQQVVEVITNTVKEAYKVFNMEYGDDYWFYFVKSYLIMPKWMEDVDKKYGSGASKLIGEAFAKYFEDNKPKAEILYENLTSDLSKDSCSKEIQGIVEEIVSLSKKQNEAFHVDVGEHYWSYMSELYSSDSMLIKMIDKKYGSGASDFIGKAFKHFSLFNK